MRRLIVVPGFVVRVALAAAFVALGAVAVLTRTGIGRDATRRSIEAAFARQFDGTLAIGELRGTLLGTLDARGVLVRTARGDTLLSAPRIVARPTLQGFFRRTVEVRSLVLERPTLRLRQRADGTWDGLRRRRRTTAPVWSLGAPVVRVEGGTVVAESAAPPPPVIARGDLADLRNARYEAIDGQATVTWTARRRLVSLERLRVDVRARGGESLSIDDLAGQFVQEDGVTTLSALHVESGATDLRGTLRIATGDAPRAWIGPEDADRPATPARPLPLPMPAPRPRPDGRSGTPGPDAPLTLAATVTGRLDADALARLVPALPVGGTFRIAATADATRRADGTADATVRGLRVESGSARIAADGSVRLALTRDTLAVAADGLALRLAAADVRRVAPRLDAALADRLAALAGAGATVSAARLRIALDCTTQPSRVSDRRAAPPRFALTADGLAAALPDADARGALALRRTLAGLAWRVDADVRRADLDRLAAVLAGTRAANARISPDGPTQIAGTLASDGTLAAPGAAALPVLDRLRLTARLALDRSTVAGRRLDSLRLDGRFDGPGGAGVDAGHLDATFALAQRLDGGVSRARGRATTTLRGGRVSGLVLDGRLDDFDTAALASARPGADPAALRTRLSGTVAADLDAATLGETDAASLLAALTGTVALRLDAARLRRDGRVLALGPLRLDAALAPRGDGGAWGDDRLVVDSDVLAADLTGTLRERALAAHADFFAARLGALARASLPARGDTATFTVPEGLPETVPVRLTGRIRVADARALATLLPVAAPAAVTATPSSPTAAAPSPESGAAAFLAGLSGDLDVTVDARVDGGGLRVALDVASARVDAGTRRAHGLRASATLADRGDGRDPALAVRFHADSLALPRRIGPTDLDARLLGAAGAVSVSADGGTVTAEGRLERTADGAATSPLRLVLRRLALARGDLRFSAPDGAAFEIYADAIVVPPTRLDAEGAAPIGDGRTRQALAVGGTVSALARDTLTVRAAAIDLGKLLGKRPERAPIGGLLDADVALSALLARPDLTGDVHVRGLTFGSFAAGDLTARADFSRRDAGAGTDDQTSAAVLRTDPVGLTLTLAPPPGLSDTDRAAATLVRARGTFRLPDATPGSAYRDGALDLAFDADRLDASVLDALFPDVLRRTTGTIVGSGTVTGSLRRPSFGGELRLRGARLAVPRFGLAYAATADARLVGDGLAITTATLTDPTGGTLDVNGGIGFNDYRFLSLDLRGRLREALLLNVPTSNELPLYGRLWASGEATLTGPVSAAVLRAPGAVVSARSEVSLPIRSTFSATDTGFIVFADSSGRLPDLRALDVRESVFRKPTGERTFVDGLEMEINLTAPAGSTINLVLDPLRGDVMQARSSGRLQIARREGEFTIFGGLDVSGGDYLFTAGDLFARRFRLDGGRIAWDGDPLNPALDIAASFRTRASLAGLPAADALAGGLVPLIVRLDLGERLLAPSVGLSLALDRDARSDLSASVQGLEAILNAPERQAEYATSVLLTNSFLLTTTLTSGENVGGAGNRLAFASLSQLVGAQVNRYLSSVVPGLEFTLGLDGAQASDLDVSAGVALRLLDERLVIRGEGVFATESTAAQPQGLRGAFVVEVRLSPAVSVEVYYRREDDALERLTASAASTTGASLSYRAQFTTWAALWRRLTGR